MKCINFDEHFADFVSEWVKKHQSEYRNFDEMEADMPKAYMEFLNTPAKWLDRITPGAYFTQFEDAKDLVDWLCAYCEQQVPVPDILLEQIVNVGRPCEKRLTELLKNESAPQEAKMTAIGLLRDMNSTLPKMLYIGWQLDRADEDELCDNALESLKAMGASVVQPIIQELPKANRAGMEALLDVLADYPGPEQTYRLAMELFEKVPSKRAIFAGYLAKIGDPRAIPDLIKAAENDECTYLNYIEIRNAIEELGGDCPDREFIDDPEYEALRGMDMN